MSCSHAQSGRPHLSLVPSNCEGAERKAPTKFALRRGVMKAADVALCWLHALRATSSFFLCVLMRRFFSRPVPSYLLAPGTSASEIRLPGTQAAGQTKQLIRAESFLGGALVGDHVCRA